MIEVIGRWIPGVEVQVNVEATPHPIPAKIGLPHRVRKSSGQKLIVFASVCC